MANKDFFTNSSKVRFLDKIIQDLDSCFTFAFSVSFIKKAGLDLLTPAIERALKRGAKGKILTSTYQNFTDIPSLEYFLGLQEKYPETFFCHLEFNSFGEDGFHTKGYLFTFLEEAEVIIGSSNITRFALLKNKEWDVSVSTNDKEDFCQRVKEEFTYLWNHTYSLDREIIRRYQIHLQYAITSWDMDLFRPDEESSIKPNQMQREALREIKRYHDMDIHRALVIAATGSGKTYLAAFDALNFGAHKLLFIVHKDVILQDAEKTFMRVFKTGRTYGIYTGESKQLNADFLFASNQIMAKHLSLFAKDEFDYIVIDEVHHAAASTYQKIISYFKPQFLLGLTATPDRMDGDNIYELFGNNVPYDLRLREALENHLIVPFHYFGIKDSLLNYGNDSPEGIRRMIQEIASEPNCAFIKEQIEKYRPAGKLKAIGFCRSVEHARLMAFAMSEQGYHCSYLTGENDTGERVKVLSDLQEDSNPLEIVFAVDIMNEGIDVPAMNMALFLRPTDSSTIFIQQLGRGLRKYKDKPYLVVLDFIANSYKRSVQIATALGSLSKSGTIDKRGIRKMVRSNFTSLGIEGLQIHFDEESQEEILRSLDSTNFNRFEWLRQDFLRLCEFLKLSKQAYPKHIDFLNNEVNVDLLKYTAKEESYYDFLLRCGKDVPFFDEIQTDVIRTIYSYLPLVRAEEYLILKSLLSGKKTFEELYQDYQKQGYQDEESFAHALKKLQDEFFYTRPKSHIKLVSKVEECYQLTFETANPTFRDWINDMLDYGLTRYLGEYAKRDSDGLSLYGRYTTVTMAMALDHNNLYWMSGVVKTKRGTCILINLNKDWQKEESLKYKDKFLSHKVIQWESMPDTTMENTRGKALFEEKNFFLFVRKTKKEDGADLPFVYLGKGKLTNPRVSDNPKHCLLFDIVLDKEVPADYNYDFGIEDLRS